MKKHLIYTLLLFAACFQGLGQAINISAARQATVGSVVTVRGIVTHGGEFGSAIRYFQDGTGGIAAYSPTLMGTVNIGDSIEVKGTCKLYNSLLELDPVSYVTVISSNNPLPLPVEMNSVNAFQEQYEGMLVKVDNVVVNGAPHCEQGCRWRW